MVYKRDYYLGEYKEKIIKMILESNYKIGDKVEYDRYNTRFYGEIINIGLSFYFQFKDYRSDDRVGYFFYGLNWDDNDFYGYCNEDRETVLSNILNKYNADIVSTELFYEVKSDFELIRPVRPEHIICRKMNDQDKIKEVFKNKSLTRIDDKEIGELIRLGVNFYLTIEDNRFKINIK